MTKDDAEQLVVELGYDHYHESRRAEPPVDEIIVSEIAEARRGHGPVSKAVLVLTEADAIAAYKKGWTAYQTSPEMSHTFACMFDVFDTLAHVLDVEIHHVNLLDVRHWRALGSPTSDVPRHHYVLLGDTSICRDCGDAFCPADECGSTVCSGHPLPD